MILKLFIRKTIIARFIISLVCILQITKAQNVGVIIDRSLSVDENNRNEAVEIIIDLLNGEATSSNSHNWVLLPEKSQLQSPEQIQLREQKHSYSSVILEIYLLYTSFLKSLGSEQDKTSLILSAQKRKMHPRQTQEPILN